MRTRIFALLTAALLTVGIAAAPVHARATPRVSPVDT